MSLHRSSRTSYNEVLPPRQFRLCPERFNVWRVLVGLFLGFSLCLTEPTEALRIKTTWGERVDLSERIIRGQVVSLKSGWNAEKTLINTDVIILVDEYMKGNGPNEITIRIPGGTVGDKTQWVSDSPHFTVGDYSVIFLEGSGQITAGPDGVFLLRDKQGDGFLSWLRAYIAGDPRVSKEGPAEPARSQPE